MRARLNLREERISKNLAKKKEKKKGKVPVSLSCSKAC